MNESIIIALEIYFFTFVISTFIALIIKAIQSVLRRVSPEGKQLPDESEGSV